MRSLQISREPLDVPSGGGKYAPVNGHLRESYQHGNDRRIDGNQQEPWTASRGLWGPVAPPEPASKMWTGRR